jgi:hypothetical protein
MVNTWGAEGVLIVMELESKLILSSPLITQNAKLATEVASAKGATARAKSSRISHGRLGSLVDCAANWRSQHVMRGVAYSAWRGPQKKILARFTRLISSCPSASKN